VLLLLYVDALVGLYRNASIPKKCKGEEVLMPRMEERWQAVRQQWQPASGAASVLPLQLFWFSEAREGRAW